MSRTIALCLLSYRPDHPSGIERSIAALIEGLRSLGHTPLVLAAGPAGPTDADEPGLIRLQSLKLARPAQNADLLEALADPRAVVDEVRAILARRRVDAACWADTLWGLGYLDPVPLGVPSALMVHKIRPGAEDRWQAALASADVVCPASDWLAAAGADAGLDTRRWVTVSNALLASAEPVATAQREVLRRSGPVRIVSRLDPVKGLPELLRAMPEGWERPVELVLAEADFEFWPGMQRDTLEACRAEQRRRPGPVSVLPALGWREVPGFFAGAAATVISTTVPETFCHTAAEALSVGTPVVAFDLGNVPGMVGDAGRAVAADSGPTGLWAALSGLLDDPAGYHAASAAAPDRVSAFTPDRAASALLAALGL